MLTALHIENIAVIERADVEFTQGLCVLTGETGAGKSIVIDSINAILGERTAKDLIRAGCERAQVTASFCDLSSEILDVLRGLDVEAEDGQVVVTRVITHKSSSAKINGVPVTATALKSVAPYLVDIHGQHDSQALLQPESHVSYIDKLAKNEQIILEYKSAFADMQKTRKALKNLSADEEERARRQEILKHTIKELENANLRDDEMNELKNRREKLLSDKEKAEKLTVAVNALMNDDGILSATDTVLEQLISAHSEKSANACSSARDLLEQARVFAEQSLAECEYDERELSEIDDRLDIYYAFEGKYGKNEKEMIETLENAKRELLELENGEQSQMEFAQVLPEQVERVKKLGAKLTKSRKDAAERFEKDVSGQLQYLNMPSVQIKVQIDTAPYSSGGADKVEFLIKTNVGEQLKPLSKIASGGEMSRIMLAIKCVLSDGDPVGTMIFDEIDAGISGEAALKVGDRLKAVALSKQVIVVTHLAQIACMAGLHLRIKKTVESDRTFTRLTELDLNGRREELARIIGGELSDAALSAADELLKRYN